MCVRSAHAVRKHYTCANMLEMITFHTAPAIVVGEQFQSVATYVRVRIMHELYKAAQAQPRPLLASIWLCARVHNKLKLRKSSPAPSRSA